MKIKVLKFENYYEPKRFHYNDAGADVYSTLDVSLLPHETKKIPLGFGLEIPDGFMGLVLPRSGLSSKGIFTQAAPIDSGYRGEIHAITTNSTKEIYEVNEGDRIGQIVIIPIIVPDFIEEVKNDRDSKGFNSTGK